MRASESGAAPALRRESGGALRALHGKGRYPARSRYRQPAERQGEGLEVGVPYREAQHLLVDTSEVAEGFGETRRAGLARLGATRREEACRAPGALARPPRSPRGPGRRRSESPDR